jgi:regulator of sirC expression with transglutaminase-like and TPR domain
MDGPGARLFQDLVDKPDGDIDLARAALAIAAEEYAGLETGPYLARLDALARDVEEASTGGDEMGILAALIDRLGRVEGFRGNREDYGDPRNSFLNEVLDRRVGIPLSLSLVYMLVGKRVGLTMGGIAFPGHFLSRCDLDEGFVVLDAFDGGRQLSLEDCQRLLQSFSRGASFEREMLEPASHRSILFRMLANLKGAYLKTGQEGRALRILERMLLLAPGHPGLHRDRGLLLFELGRAEEALRDLEQYQELAPTKAAGDPAALALMAVAKKRRLSLN